MSWASALRKQIKTATEPVYFQRPEIPQHTPDWARLVSLDFETYYDADYTLKKMSTSEYVRDPRFKAQMLGIKIGYGKTRIILAKNIRAELAKIPWATHSVLCHNTQFDGFILSQHYGVHPAYLYDSLSMARGLHSNDIGAGLDEVSVFYGGKGKLDGTLEKTKGVLTWPKDLNAEVSTYCANDVDEMLRVFKLMLPKMPADEIDLIDMITRMFTSPVLRVDLDRVEKELARELERREKLMYAAVDPSRYDLGGDLYNKKEWMAMLDVRERLLEGTERDMHIIKKIIGANEKFANLLRDEGVEPPTKVSDAWMKKSKEEREDESGKYTYAFAKDDIKFANLPLDIESWGYDLEDPEQLKECSAKQDRLQSLVDVRIAVKSTTNVTRAERFLVAGSNGMALPVGYAYYRAHTGRLGGNNKMNMQNLTRGGELRLSILAPKGQVLCVQDSGQIEARVNAWLWGQEDLLQAFATADKWNKKTMGVATGDNRDAYCRFADLVYGREITTDDSTERFVGKVCIAEGELVLTHRGLVPINLISKEDWLWDGVEWITHDGVIDQGIREVITYDGLTATPDHEVFTEDGRVIPLGQAASEMVRLQRTGAEGQSIRFCDDHVIADTPRKRLSVRVGLLQSEQSQETDLPQQPQERQDDILPQERTQASAACRSAGAEVRRYIGAMHQSFAQALGELRRARHQEPICFADGIHPVGVDKSPAQGLQGCGDRQDGQRRALRAGELTVSDAAGKHTEPPQHREDYVVGQTLDIRRFSEPLQQNLDLQARGAARAYGGADIRQVRVFDIANAGPRLRYTVSDKLVFNCVLGLGYQMGGPKLQMTLAKGALGGPPVHFPLEQCKGIVNAYRAANYKIRNGWEICKRIIDDMAHGREGSHGPINWEANTIWLPNGMALKYPDLRKATDEQGWDAWTYQSGDQRKKIYGGLLCENIVQALARIIVMWQMLQINKKNRCVMTTHDEVVALAKIAAAQKCVDLMAKWMRTPPPWCSGLALNTEGGWAENYSK